MVPQEQNTAGRLNYFYIIDCWSIILKLYENTTALQKLLLGICFCIKKIVSFIVKYTAIILS